MINFYSLTSYPPYNTTTTMQQNRPRLLTTPIKLNKQFFAMVFFIASFLLANHYTNSPLLKKCLADTTINNDFCYKKFVG
tara:strand:+ start:2885 stop:3124 length:240 start_codon:yes stop_codon:yes gene_type:complete